MKLSVIVPIYNGEKYINRCLDSLVNQTIDDIEYIVINDGSTDNTDTIIKKYLPNQKIKYFKRDNHGIGNTRNFGLKQATGEYIGFVDGDDYIEDNMFEILYNKAIKDNLDMVVCDFYRDYEEDNKQIVECINGLDNSNLFVNPSLVNKINTSPWNKIYKKSLISSENDLFPEKIKYEDAPFVMNMMIKAQKIGKVDVPLYHYMIHKNSETTKVDEKIFDIFPILNIIQNQSKDKIYLKDEIEYFIVQRLSDYNIQQRNQKDRKTRNKFIEESFKYIEANVSMKIRKRYYANIGFLKGIIESNQIITKFYCELVNLFKINKK